MRSASRSPLFDTVCAGVLAVSLACCATASHERREANATHEPQCAVASFPKLPGLAVTSATPEPSPVPHCEVSGVIGLEIHFELS